MKLKTPAFPRKGHHESVAPDPASPRPVPAPRSAPTVLPTTPASALKKAAGGLATPTRQRNAAAMIAGAALIIVAGAIGASVASSFDDSINVLVAAEQIDEGDRIEANDFRVVQIAAAAGDIEVMSPDSIDDLVGRVAAGPIGEGSMIHPDQFAVPFSEQQIIIGASLEPNQYPAGGVKVGDQVRLIAIAGRSYDGDGPGIGREIAIGEVAEVYPLGSSRLHVSLRVPESTANLVAQLVANDRISLGLLDNSVAIDEVPALSPATTFDPATLPEESGE